MGVRHAAGVKRVGPAADREQKTRWAAGAQTENLQRMGEGRRRREWKRQGQDESSSGREMRTVIYYTLVTRACMNINLEGSFSVVSTPISKCNYYST